jgi:MFS family permease
MTTIATKLQQPIRSTIPARLDRLRWSPFHTRLVLGPGTAWILDGLEITIASSVTSKLTQASTLNLSTVQAASIGTAYLVGEIVRALVFGRLSDKLGRRKLFMWTLAIYLVGTGLSALAMKGTGGMIYFYATRFIAGSGIGGEYAAVNSAIDEMMPARYGGAPISGSTAATGSGRSSARWPRSCCSTRCRRTRAGGSDSWSARCSRS